ncbi:unnamed protein product [Symbiodinium natans]|uniref:Uncharacterized protein n=1 Tax=Symbiodinium natans TaxID=878477 RepID=A0A812SIH9_9DINO|nr:unnamed protein product [Symbiodinium natans]
MDAIQMASAREHTVPLTASASMTPVQARPVSADGLGPQRHSIAGSRSPDLRPGARNSSRLGAVVEEDPGLKLRSPQVDIRTAMPSMSPRVDTDRLMSAPMMKGRKEVARRESHGGSFTVPGGGATASSQAMISTSQGTGGSDSSSLASTWVLETLKKSLLQEAVANPKGSMTGPCLPAGVPDMVQELRQIRQEMRRESEARKQLGTNLDSLLQEERKRRDEAIRTSQSLREQCESRLEQRWHTTVKEESALRRAVESHLEARLGAMQREVRLEVGAAATQTQQVLSEFGHFRDNIRQELDLQKLEISNATADLSRLVDQLRTQARGEVTSPTASSSITEGLVRAEVRRQLNERSSEAVPGVTSVPPGELQALASRVEHLEKALEAEATSRHEEATKLLSTFHELVAGGRQRHDEALQEVEKRLQAKLDTAVAEAKAVQEAAETHSRSQAAEMQATREREETYMLLLKSFDEKIPEERLKVQALLAEQQVHLETTTKDLEKQLQASLEASVASFVERSSKELMTNRQDLLELREELQEVARSSREGLDKAVSRLSRPPAADAPGPELETGAKANPLLPDLQDVQRLIDGHTKLREELWVDVDRVRNELRLESSSRKDDVQGVRSSVDRIREQVMGMSSLPASGGAATGLSGTSAEELRAAVAAERLAREDGDDRCMQQVRELLGDERQKRVSDISALELRVQSEEQTLFVESGKREERDRDILSQLTNVFQELDSVKLQMTGTAAQQRQKLDELSRTQATQAAQAAQGAVAQVNPPHQVPSTVPKLAPRGSGSPMNSGFVTPTGINVRPAPAGHPVRVGQAPHLQWPAGLRAHSPSGGN